MEKAKDPHGMFIKNIFIDKKAVRSVRARDKVVFAVQRGL